MFSSVVKSLLRGWEWPWASAEIFPWGCNVNVLLIIFRLLTLQCKRMFTKRFTVSTPQRKHELYSHLFWNPFQVELFRPTHLPQKCSFCHPLQILLNWCISIQLSLKWTWTINKYVCGSLTSIYWMNRITSEIICPNNFLHFAYQKCFFFS